MSKSKVILVSDDLNEVLGENKPFFSRFQIDVWVEKVFRRFRTKLYLFFKSKSQKQKPYRFQIKVEIEVWGRFQAKLWIICVIDGCKFLQKVAFYLYCQSKNTLNKTNLPSDYKIRVHSFRFQIRILKLRQKGIYLMISNQSFKGASKKSFSQSWIGVWKLQQKMPFDNFISSLDQFGFNRRKI